MSRLPSAWETNHAAVIEVLRRQGPATRPELERVTGLGRKIVSERVGELLDLGLVVEGDFAESTGGRMPRRIDFRSDRGLVAVVEMNVYHSTLGLTDLAGRILRLIEIDAGVGAGPDAAFDRINAATRDLMIEIDRPLGALWGVGVGVLAPVDLERGSILPGHLFDETVMAGWDGYPVRDRLHRLLDRPVWVDNEVNLMALGELRTGRARGCQDVVYAKLGPSVGGGVVLGGQLQHGLAAAGEIGHLVVPGDEPRSCWCGGRGCLDTFITADALLEETGGSHASITDLFNAAAGGDPMAVAVLDRAGSRIGAVLAAVVTLLNPALLLVGGVLVDESPIVLQAMSREVEARGMATATTGLRIEHSPLSDRAGLVGASAMVVDALFSATTLGIWLTDGDPLDHVQQLMTAS